MHLLSRADSASACSEPSIATRYLTPRLWFISLRIWLRPSSTEPCFARIVYCSPQTVLLSRMIASRPYPYFLPSLVADTKENRARRGRDPSSISIPLYFDARRRDDSSSTSVSLDFDAWREQDLLHICSPQLGNATRRVGRVSAGNAPSR